MDKSINIVVTIGDSFTITTTELPTGLQNSNYFAILETENGEAPVSYKITDGQLPTGISLNRDGSFEGTPLSPEPEVLQYRQLIVSAGPLIETWK